MMREVAIDHRQAECAQTEPNVAGISSEITAKDRRLEQTDAQLAALFRSMMSYTGKTHVEGDRFISKVDVSWNQAWNGSEQERNFRIDAGRLEIISGWTPHLGRPDKPLMRGILTWNRED